MADSPEILNIQLENGLRQSRTKIYSLDRSYVESDRHIYCFKLSKKPGYIL